LGTSKCQQIIEKNVKTHRSMVRVVLCLVFRLWIFSILFTMLTFGRVEMSRLVDLLMILIGFGIANVATVRRYVGAQMKYFNKGKLNVFCYVL